MKREPCQVSVIIVNYNSTLLLKNCIQSIHALTQGLSYEIIVVDNDSKENPADVLQMDYPDVHFINSSTNLGFGRANNFGVQHAQGEYLFFLNSDTVLLNNAIPILYHFLEAHPKAGICGGNLYDGDGNPNVSYFKFPVFKEEWKIFFPKKQETSNMEGLYNFGQQPQRVECISGADLMIRKSLFVLANGFDPDFFLYYEETEMTHRCRKLGYLAYSVPQAKITHYGGMSTTKQEDCLRQWSYQEYAYSKFLYYHKIGKKHYPMYSWMINMLKVFSALFFYGCIGKKKKISYWREKREIINHIYNRYLSFVTSKEL